jgi:hypothetical protein
VLAGEQLQHSEQETSHAKAQRCKALPHFFRIFFAPMRLCEKHRFVQAPEWMLLAFPPSSPAFLSTELG